MVKSFVVGVANGLQHSFQALDDMVNGLGDVEIVSIQDTYYPVDRFRHRDTDPHFVRVVQYRDKK